LRLFGEEGGGGGEKQLLDISVMTVVEFHSEADEIQ